MRGFTLIELMIVIMIIGILTAIIVPAFSRDDTPQESPAVETTIDPNYGRLKNPDGSFVRPNNDHRSNAGNSTSTNVGNTGDSTSEMCHDGIVYVRIIMNGIATQSAKENRYGDRERC